MSFESGGSSHRVQPIPDAQGQRIDEGKIQVKFYMNPDVYLGFKQFVREKHGGADVKGLLSFEAEQALIEYAGLRARKQTQKKALIGPHGPPHKVAVVKQKVIAILREKYGYELTNYVLRQHVDESLSQLYVDRRTQIEWLKRFQRHGLMRWVDDLHLEFI